jgi:CBS domain containing-hemolysin-like protein
MNVGYSFEGHLPRHKYGIDMLESGEYLMDGRVPINEASDRLEVKLPSVDAHTVGGLVISHLRHIPVKGESVIQAGYRFVVEDVNDRGILQLRVERVG